MKRKDFLTGLLLSLFLLASETFLFAQPPPKMRVVLAMPVDISIERVPKFAATTRDLLTEYFRDYGFEGLEVVDDAEMLKAAAKLKIEAPLIAGNRLDFRRGDLMRLARELKAEAILDISVLVIGARWSEPGRRNVFVHAKFFDLALDEYLCGRYEAAAAKDVHQALEKAMTLTLRGGVPDKMECEVTARQGDLVSLNRGLRDDCKPGGSFLVVRNIGGRQSKIGTLRVSRAYARESEAEIWKETLPVAAGDKCVRLYTFTLNVWLGVSVLASR